MVATLADPIPQDVIDTTIDYLAGDLITLRSCALVSSSCLRASRKHIFSQVQLYTRRATSNLLAVLNQNPNISTLITTLHLPLDLPGDIASAILLLLKHVLYLVIGHADHHIEWEEMAPELHAVLVSFLKTQVLETVKLTSISDIPPQFLYNLSRVKSLRMENIHFVNDPDYNFPDTAPVMQLESIHFSEGVIMSTDWPCKYTPNLRQCSFQRRYGLSVVSAQRVIISSPHTISDIIWRDYHGPDTCKFLSSLSSSD
jgi:hypothetical protein